MQRYVRGAQPEAGLHFWGGVKLLLPTGASPSLYVNFGASPGAWVHFLLGQCCFLIMLPFLSWHWQSGWVVLFPVRKVMAELTGEYPSPHMVTNDFYRSRSEPLQSQGLQGSLANQRISDSVEGEQAFHGISLMVVTEAWGTAAGKKMVVWTQGSKIYKYPLFPESHLFFVSSWNRGVFSPFVLRRDNLKSALTRQSFYFSMFPFCIFCPGCSLC